MRLASKGLGKVTLPFRFTEARITEAPDCVVFEGRIKEKKVNWTYRAEVEDADLVNFVILARDPAVVAYLAERLGVGLFGKVAVSALKLVISLLFRRGLASKAPIPQARPRAVAQKMRARKIRTQELVGNEPQFRSKGPREVMPRDGLREGGSCDRKVLRWCSRGRCGCCSDGLT